MSKPDYAELAESITAKFVAILDAGEEGSWSAPWNDSGNWAPKNAKTNAYYKGANVIILALEADMRGYSDSSWATYRQWVELGGQVQKGQEGTYITKWVPIASAKEKKAARAEGRKPRKDMLLPRVYNVFNSAQQEGWEVPVVEAIEPGERHQGAEEWLKNSGAAISFGGNKAFYSPSSDSIKVPDFEDFNSSEDFYSTSFHELTHWTGTKARCNRDLSGRFGNEAYAIEELVAEMGAAFTCARVGVSSVPRQDHAAYLASWIKVLKTDSKALFAAASKASASVEFVAGLQGESNDVEFETLWEVSFA